MKPQVIYKTPPKVIKGLEKLLKDFQAFRKFLAQGLPWHDLMHELLQQCIDEGASAQEAGERMIAAGATPMTASREVSGARVQFDARTQAAVDAGQSAINGSPIKTSGAPASIRVLRALKMSHTGKLMRPAAAALAGVKSTTGSFRNNLSEMKNNDWVIVRGQELEITSAGREAAGPLPQVRTRADLKALWAPNIGRTPMQILEVVLVYGEIGAEAIAVHVNQAREEGETISHTTGSFRNNMAVLVTTGLVDRVRTGVFKPSEVWSQV